MKIIPIWFHQKSQSYPQRSFSNDFISQIHMSQTICVRTKTAAASKASGSRSRAAENEGAVAALRPGAPHKATPDAEPPVAG